MEESGFKRAEGGKFGESRRKETDGERQQQDGALCTQGAGRSVNSGVRTNTNRQKARAGHTKAQDDSQPENPPRQHAFQYRHPRFACQAESGRRVSAAREEVEKMESGLLHRVGTAAASGPV